jgi:hypothetical protein
VTGAAPTALATCRSWRQTNDTIRLPIPARTASIWQLPSDRSNSTACYRRSQHRCSVFLSDQNCVSFPPGLDVQPTRCSVPKRTSANGIWDDLAMWLFADEPIVALNFIAPGHRGGIFLRCTRRRRVQLHKSSNQLMSLTTENFCAPAYVRGSN